MIYNYGIIGGGPAGYSVAINLAKQGYSVILFEKNKLGGTCMNNGCIPTKSFLHSAEIFSNIQNLKELGLEINEENFDFTKVIEKKDKTIEKVRKGLELSVKTSGVETVYSEATIKDEHTIVANNENYEVDNIIIATGSKPKEIKGLEFDSKFILSSDDILKLTTLPKNILIIGSGAIGIEWARIFKGFNSQVSIVEMAEHLIPLADIEVSKRIERIFKQKGVKYYLNNCIDKIENKIVTLKNGEQLSPDIILVAIGRIPLETPKNPKITILGDACREIQLAHYAIHQAKEYSLNIPFRKDLVPSVIYGEPEIAWVGLREQDIDNSYQKIMMPITALGKAWCDEATDGLIKLIVKEDKIYGAHIVSKEASALIHTILVAMQNNITISKLKESCFAHPTFSEGIFELISRI